jgi:rod shape-determining protein MreB and related proteins
MRWPKISSWFTQVGIDLGSTRVRIWTNHQGVVVDEPAVLAVDMQSGKVIAVGKDAAAMEGRLQPQIAVKHPVQAGLVEDVDELKALLKVLLQRVFQSPYFFRPIIMVSVPARADEVMRQAVVDVVYSVGARAVYTIAQPLAAAIGAGVPIAETSGSFIFHAGGGVVEVGVTALGSLIRCESSTRAGNLLNQLIAQEILEKEQLTISLSQAEKLKKKLASITKRDSSELVAGQDAATLAPKEVAITSRQITAALKPVIVEYVALIKRLLAHLPPELTADVIDKGLLLSGGLAQLPGLDRYLVAQVGVPVMVVEDPDTVVINGIATALEHLDLFKESLGYTA